MKKSEIKDKLTWAAIVLLLVLGTYVGLSGLVFSIRHPYMTQVEVAAHLIEVVTWREVTREDVEKYRKSFK